MRGPQMEDVTLASMQQTNWCRAHFRAGFQAANRSVAAALGCALEPHWASASRRCTGEGADPLQSLATAAVSANGDKPWTSTGTPGRM